MGIIALLFLAVINSTGCANYRLGNTAPTPFSSITIAPIQNSTTAAQVQPILHQQLSNDLSQAGSLRVVATDSQATLQVRIIKYDHLISATRSDDTVLGSSFRLVMTAHCTLTDNRTGKTYFKDREIRAEADAHDTGSYSATEYETIPVLTRELAKKITNAIVSTW